MKRPLPMIALVLAAALALAACSGSEAATTTGATTTVTSDLTTTAPAGSQFDVVMESFAFAPAELTVPVGATVTWTNRQGTRHDVVATDGTFASPLFGEDETFSFTFDTPGQYPYVCSIHPGMEGTITVTP